MIFRMLRVAFAAALVLAGGMAHAAITCTFSSTGWSTAYVPTTATTNTTQSTVQVTCQRNAGGDGTTVNFTISVNNGLHAAGAQNRAQLNATNRINYENYQDGGCGTIWGNPAAQRISGSITGLTGFAPMSTNVSFWGCVPGSQTGLAAGTYTDTVTMTLRYGGATNPTATFPVTIVSPASCTISTAPGTVSFTYSAFQAAVSNASTNFGVTCTNLLPYTMALDATTAVIAGLQYSLALSSSSATGTGAAQAYTVDGTMPANQAGTCGTGSCATTQPRTLTISY
ncbi:MAG TPA: spore coat protein U domain-containing protein [Usitatibacter sp.]|nr:spore coat protein U domain-containing protein [Usitatibacter sp.]